MHYKLQNIGNSHKIYLQNGRKNTTWKTQEYSILINPKETVGKVVKWIHPLQNRVNRRAVVGMLMNLQVQ
jgi:hypothetical protein